MRTAGLPSRIRRVAALALLALAAPTFAQVAEPGYTIGEHASAAGWNLSIRGEWPTQCAPALDGVRLDGNDLRIDVRSPLSLCERRPMPFAIELDPALALDRAELAPGVYRVSFYAADGAQAAPKLRALALLERGAPDGAAVVPEAGFWWSSGDVDAGRTVLSLEAQGGELSVALMSYDRFGQPLWYFGAAPLRGHVAHVPLLYLAGGHEPFAAAAAPPRGEPALTLDLQFESGAHALGWLSRERGDGSLQLQGFDLVRLPLAEAADGAAWRGDWVLVADSDETAPQRLRLAQYRDLDAQHFELRDAAGIVLLCTREPTQPEWPPSSCGVRRADGSLLGTLDSVALTRMDGVRGDGVALHLLRVTR